MTYWRSHRWQLCFCHHTPPRWRSALCRPHSNLHHRGHFPWTGRAWSGMERSFAEFKKCEHKRKRLFESQYLLFFLRTHCIVATYLDWQPAINVFEIERSLVFTECKSVICAEALQFLLIAHHKYLNKRQNNRVPCILALYEITLKTIIIPTFLLSFKLIYFQLWSKV